MGGLAAIFRFLAELTGLAAKRQELNNSPAMQAAAKARQEQAAKDEAIKAVADRDSDSVRRGLSE